MSKRKLLLADDSITIQKVVNLTFADEGIEVIPVGDGDSAMRKFDEFMPDLVMADVNMPGLTGYEVCRIIKNTEETRHIPVILLVGSFEPFDEEEAKSVGADDFLTKPFQSIRQLVNKVTDLLNQSVQEATDEYYTENPPPSVVDTFAETLEFEKRSDEESTTEFGDAGMDDEMIETSPANGFAAGTESDYQAESTIDYAKTQPLNADDLKGFNIVPMGDYSAEETQEADENQESTAETTEETTERAEPATFEEEAEKLSDTPNYEEPEAEETADNISETEPQIDYYLPVAEEKFEKELTDAETLEPEVSYSAEEPRTPDFSQAPAEESNEIVETEDANETEAVEETPETETDYVEESEAEAPEETESDSTEETEDEAASETESVETPEAETSEEIDEKSEVSSAPVNMSSLNFDDGDLLELPPLVEETGIRPQPQVQQLKSEPEPEAVTAETETEVTEPETTETQEAPAQYDSMQSFPPELIEAIAQRVAEKISDRTMQDVLPQITRLVMQKMAEEKKE